jgi:hypothetical protein
MFWIPVEKEYWTEVESAFLHNLPYFQAVRAMLNMQTLFENAAV